MKRRLLDWVGCPECGGVLHLAVEREAAEEHLKDLLEVSSLATVTKVQATQMIDRLLQTSDPASRGGGGNGAAARPLR